MTQANQNFVKYHLSRNLHICIYVCIIKKFILRGKHHKSTTSYLRLLILDNVRCAERYRGKFLLDAFVAPKFPAVSRNGIKQEQTEERQRRQAFSY